MHRRSDSCWWKRTISGSSSGRIGRTRTAVPSSSVKVPWQAGEAARSSAMHGGSIPGDFPGLSPMTIAETLLPEFDREMGGPRRLLERLPDGRFDWQPHPRSMSLGRLAEHLAELPGWGTTMIQKDGIDGAVNARPAGYAAPATTQAVLAMFDANVVEARKALAGRTDTDLAAMWTPSVAGKQIFSMPKAAVLRGFVLESPHPPPRAADGLSAHARRAVAVGLRAECRRAGLLVPAAAPPPGPRLAGRRRAVLFAILATLNAGGYRYGAADQAFYIPAVLRHLIPGGFPRDGAMPRPRAVSSSSTRSARHSCRRPAPACRRSPRRRRSRSGSCSRAR